MWIKHSDIYGGGRYMTGEWETTSNYVGGKTLYGVVFRGNRDVVYGELFDNKDVAQTICNHLNEITASIKRLAASVPKLSLMTYLTTLRLEWCKYPHMIEAIDIISQKYI
jgi:hypothetical protein